MGRIEKHKTRHRFHTPGDFRELTFSCYDHLPLLTCDDWCRRLARRLDKANEEFQILLVGFVFMPEHVHLLVYPKTPEPRIDDYLAAFKQPFSSAIKRILRAFRSPLLAKLTVRERPGKKCFRYWEEGGGYDRNLNSPRSIQSSLDYIHLNPVRRGLCERAIDWKWSSARFYLCDPPVHDPDLPEIHGVPVGALD